MDSHNLQHWQAAKMHAKLGPTLGYLNGILNRMDRTGFPDEDKLRKLVEEARDAMHGLTIDLHYRSCKGGVGGYGERQGG